jgi:hypothetical protein
MAVNGIHHLTIKQKMHHFKAKHNCSATDLLNTRSNDLCKSALEMFITTGFPQLNLFKHSTYFNNQVSLTRKPKISPTASRSNRQMISLQKQQYTFT